MIHQFRDKKQINQRRNFFRIILILILFLFFAFSGFLTISGKIWNYIGRPIWETKQIITNDTESLSYLTQSKSSLLKENEKLSQENSDLKISMIDYQILKNDNEKLKELLNNISTPSEFILAGILVKPSYSPYDTMIIDAGQENGIATGMKVYVGGNVPVGIISEVYSKTSLVELYSNPGKITAGIIEGPNVGVDLIGRGGGNFEMSVPFELVVLDGTFITLPGIQSEILAVIEKEISEPTDPIKKVILRSPVNIQNQKWVEIKKN